jgi:hypothetical protein
VRTNVPLGSSATHVRPCPPREHRRMGLGQHLAPPSAKACGGASVFATLCGTDGAPKICKGQRTSK